MYQDQLVFSEEVRSAMDCGVPVVALESTIISHGMPYPENIKTTKKVVSIIKNAGCVPAIVAVDDGKLHVGIDDLLLERLAKEEGVLKVSRRDMPIALASGALGATTVSGTLIAAERAGIKVFVTGGVGGVHREAFNGEEPTLDVSADIEELTCSNVMVVCAGVKSILDLPKTLELLETKGIPVIGYGTGEFPAFYTRSSGLALAARADSPEEIAKIMMSKWGLGLEGAILVVNPIPEDHEMDAEMINLAIDKALRLAESEGIKGKNVTPFLLQQVSEATFGASLIANIALIENNARVGAAIAVAFAKQV